LLQDRDKLAHVFARGGAGVHHLPIMQKCVGLSFDYRLHAKFAANKTIEVEAEAGRLFADTPVW